MDTTRSFHRFEDVFYKNWIKTTMGLEYLKTRLENFLECETQSFHRSPCDSVRSDTTWNGQECSEKCDFRNWIPGQNKIPQFECEVCAPWRDGILANHAGKDGRVFWRNSTPWLWPTDKWEVAKVYMSSGQKTHKKSVGDFDLAALLVLMNQCKHFRKFVQGKSLTEVVSVRNRVMHSPNFRVKLEDLHDYLDQIRALGQELEEHVPEFKSLSKEIDELQNLDFSLILQGKKAQESSRFLSMELQIMKQKMECLAQLYEEGSQRMLTLEELQGVRVFLEGNKDLQEKLVPQWERLSKVQEQQGQQINSLTGRVEQLEKKTHIPESDAGLSIPLHKNHLYEIAKKRGWPDPVFSEKREPAGFRGQVKIKDQTFTGLQVHRSIKQAHQEVAKIALQDPAIAIANAGVDVVDPVSQSEVLQAGPSFFGNVTVGLKIQVSSDTGRSGTEQDLMESAYQKLAAVFGLDLSASGSCYKEVVLQYCQRCDSPPPEESIKSGGITLRLSGHLTFYDLKGSSKKAEANKQAAKAALQGLSGVLEKSEVFPENYIRALKELLDAAKLYSLSYDVSETPGEGVRWVGSKGKGGGQRDGKEKTPGEAGEVTHRNKGESHEGEEEGTGHHAVAESTERETGTDGRLFLGCVKVKVHKKLKPCEGSSQEGAVQAAYSSLRSALSLDPPAVGEKQSVLEFFTQTMCRLPEEDIVRTTDGNHRCTLTIDGEFTFYGPEGASRKQQTEQLAAKKALMHLKGLLSTTQPAEKNYKSRLQELLAKHGGDVKPQYSIENPTSTATDGRPFLGCVKVNVHKELKPCEGSSQEGAVQAAYSSLRSALSLDPPAVGEKQSVLEFFTQTMCRLPEEDIVRTTDGNHRCTLTIDGEFTFYSPEGASRKQQTEQLAAKKALRHLKGLLSTTQPGLKYLFAEVFPN